MNKRPWRRSHNYSRTSLRKLRGTLILLFILVPMAVAAQSTIQSFAVLGGELKATIAVDNPPSQRVINSLRDGLESEVQYNVRVYQASGGLLGLFGDRLIGEYHRTYQARWDEFSGDFIVDADSKTVQKTISAQNFVAGLFSLSNVDTGIHLPPGTYYVLSDVRIQIVKLVPPLTMIAPFLAQRQLETSWVKTEVSVP